MRRILVYSDKNSGVSAESQKDLVEVFVTKKIVEKPEIMQTDFKESWDGIEKEKTKPLVVIPGGAFSQMSFTLGEQKKKIYDVVQCHGWDLLGICAGAYLGCKEKYISRPLFDTDNLDFFSPLICDEMLTKEVSTIGICSEYVAMGPFYPNGSYQNRMDANPDLFFSLPPLLKGKSVPYNATIVFSDDKKSENALHQLYVGGCGFKKLSSPENKSDFTVVAHYENSVSYRLQLPKDAGRMEAETIHNFPAIIQRKAKKSTEGNVLLSGVHIEALPGSKLLGLFLDSGRENVVLEGREAKELSDKAQHNNFDKMILPVLQETFKPKC
jgi:glutamine amidotransferase-like uncharacterized protein